MIRIKRLLKSFKYALNGLIKTFREEQNLRIQLTATLIIILAGWYFKIERLEWALIIFAIGLVILAEIINSAAERITDVLRPRINTYVKTIKDIMAAAVMFASLIAFLIGLLVFFPKLF
ncbi:MAG: diacylglycerol kinase family protein [Patescibacteria group bacterium]|nr:diacylglycerol kinase family protein [Patescibacteria group bacterium]